MKESKRSLGITVWLLGDSQSIIYANMTDYCLFVISTPTVNYLIYLILLAVITNTLVKLAVSN